MAELSPAAQAVLDAFLGDAELQDHFVGVNKLVPQPVPVSERLPSDQLCWWYEPDEDDGYGGMWTLLRIRGGTTRYSHWLPAHALPLPSYPTSLSS